MPIDITRFMFTNSFETLFKMHWNRYYLGMQIFNVTVGHDSYDDYTDNIYSKPVSVHVQQLLHVLHTCLHPITVIMLGYGVYSYDYYRSIDAVLKY